MQLIFDGQEFDRVVHGSLPCGSENDAAIVCKDEATQNGKPCVCITFIAGTPSDGPRRVQLVITARTLLTLAAGIAGKYSHVEGLTNPIPLPPNAPQTLRGSVKGIGYDAVLMERVYLFHMEGHAGISVATSEFELRAIVEAEADRRDREKP